MQFKLLTLIALVGLVAANPMFLAPRNSCGDCEAQLEEGLDVCNEGICSGCALC